MHRILPLTLGLSGLTACVKSAPPETSFPQTIVDSVRAEETVVNPSETSPPVVPPESIDPISSVDPEKTTTMRLQIGFGSEPVLAVNVACGEFRVRRSIQNKEVVIPNVPLNSPQCRMKFSPGGGVYILQDYKGGVVECTVSNGNEATCR